MSSPAIEALGDQALLLRWADVADLVVNQRVHAFARRLRAASAPWLIDCVPAYASLAIFIDSESMTVPEPLLFARDWLSSMINEAELQIDAAVSRIVEIPVCYGGDHGPDLDEIASACGLSGAQLIDRHVQPEYLVAMLGFSPGFPYLLGMDPALATPRLATPRLRIPAGSVGIAGSQTGIYPNEGPGGWRLIGRTPQLLFDARREQAAHVLPGDRVRFIPIDAARFDVLSGQRT